MAQITSVTVAWQNVTITADEIWQVRNGIVDIDTDPSNQLGLRLKAGDAVCISAGKTVYYRLSAGCTATATAIARVAV